MRSQRATKAIIATRYLHRLVLHVVVRLADTFLSLDILMGSATASATLIVVAGLGSALEVFESIASLRPN